MCHMTNLPKHRYIRKLVDRLVKGTKIRIVNRGGALGDFRSCKVRITFSWLLPLIHLEIKCLQVVSDDDIRLVLLIWVIRSYLDCVIDSWFHLSLHSTNNPKVSSPFPKI